MVRTFVFAPLVLALAACGNGDARSVDAENQARAAMAAAAAKPVAGPNMLAPGQWETKTRLRSIDQPGMDAETRRQLLGEDTSIDQCLPPEEARRPDANFFAGGGGSECSYTRFNMRGGKIAAVMGCNAGPGSITLKISGTYTPTSYQLDAATTTSGVPGAPASTTARLSGTWLGACLDPSSQRAPEDPAR